MSLEDKLAARGLSRPRSESLGDWLERIRKEPTLAGIRGPLLEAVRLHCRYRFDPQGINETQRQGLQTSVEACLRGIDRIPDSAETQSALHLVGPER